MAHGEWHENVAIIRDVTTRKIRKIGFLLFVSFELLKLPSEVPSLVNQLWSKFRVFTYSAA